MSDWKEPYSPEIYEEALKLYADHKDEEAQEWMGGSMLPALDRLTAWNDVAHANAARRTADGACGAPLYGKQDCGIKGYPNCQAQSYAALIALDVADGNMQGAKERIGLALDTSPEVAHRIECAMVENCIRNHYGRKKAE